MRCVLTLQFVYMHLLPFCKTNTETPEQRDGMKLLILEVHSFTIDNIHLGSLMFHSNNVHISCTPHSRLFILHQAHFPRNVHKSTTSRISRY